MAQQHLNYGSSPDDGTGDKLRPIFEKIESNLSELFAKLAAIMAGADPSLDTFAEVRTIITGFNAVVNTIPSPTAIQATIDAAAAATIAAVLATIAGGAVASVNGHGGIVVLTAADVGAAPTATVDAAVTSLRAYALALGA